MYNCCDNEKRYTHPNPIIKRYHIRRLMTVIGELKRIIKADGSKIFLDVGCGDGTYLFLLRRDYDLLIGLDISLQNLKMAKKKMKNMDSEVIEFILADARYIPFVSSSIDVVLCSEVLEHIAAPEEVLNELFRVFRQTLLITIPVLSALRAVAKIICYNCRINRLEKCIGHINMHNRNWWINLISKITTEKKINHKIMMRVLYLYFFAEPFASIFAYVNNIPNVVSRTLDIFEKVLSRPLLANQMIISILMKNNSK
ncbi:MAG: class I SAM-dependent methyltransferase [Nitrososphaeria archaeon]